MNTNFMRSMNETKTAFLFLLTVIFMASCGKVPTAEPNQSFDHFIGDFENGNLSGFHFLVVDTNVNTIMVNNPVRKGNHALKNTLRPDNYIFNGYRAELSVYNCAKYKTDVYYGFSVMIDTSYSDNQYNLVCQWQDLPNYLQGENWEPSPVLHGSPPPVQLTYVNGTFELRMNDNPNSSNQTFLVGNAQTISKGQWYDLVFHIYWCDDAAAFIEAWLNGNVFTPFNGTDNKYYKRNLYTRDGNYFKFGQYRGKDQPLHTNVIYFDEIKVGSSYSEVAP
ncbi:MAG: polysaccharide lyase [Bacteroidetes bacterium]|nr:polysaccharide lyase [Bacteroidota bacterium]